MKIPCTIAALVLLTAACSPDKSREAASADTASATVATATGEMTDTASGATAAAQSDPDQATGGGGIPAGHHGRTDRPDARIEDVKYAMRDGRWEVQTGPAHILYSDKNTASGTYTASVTIEQLEAPKHPEAFGLFIGGQDLEGQGQKYTYFLVRGGGEYLVKVRDGTGTKDVIKWQANDAVPKADASGKATYRLAVQVGQDSVRFLVNDKQVGAVPKKAVPTDGVVGLRINHNLHVAATPVRIVES